MKHPKAESITISRIPKATKVAFMEFSEEFCGDYGMALKYLLDFSLNYSQQMDHMLGIMAEHEQRLNELTENTENEKKEVRKTLGGKIIPSPR